MKVSAFFKKFHPVVLLPLAMCTPGIAIFYNAQQEVKQSAEYLRQNAPEKYYQLVQENGEPAYPGLCWREAAQQHKDSLAKDAIKQQEIQEKLKLDSIAKTNYALGMQAIRDSLEAVKK